MSDTSRSIQEDKKKCRKQITQAMQATNTKELCATEHWIEIAN